MATEKMRQFTEGRALWQQYVNVNGYAFTPTESGLKKLSRNLDLNVSYLKKLINAFLEA